MPTLAMNLPPTRNRSISNYFIYNIKKRAEIFVFLFLVQMMNRATLIACLLCAVVLIAMNGNSVRPF